MNPRKPSLAALLLGAFLVVLSGGCQTGPSGPETWPTEAPFPTFIPIDHGATKVAVIKLDVEIARDQADVFDLEIYRASAFDEVVIEIDSGGGDLYSADRMRHAIAASEVPVTCVVRNLAASAAFLVLQACPFRLMTPHSYVMLHEARTTVPAKNIVEAIGNMLHDRALNDEISPLFCSRLSIPADECYERYRGREWYMGAEEAVGVGAADSVTPSLWSYVDDLASTPRGEVQP